MKTLISARPQYLSHQTWQSSNLQSGDPTFKVIWLFDYVVTWQIQKPYICSSAIPMATKLGWVVTWVGGPHRQSLVIFWLHGHVTNSENLYLHFRNTYHHQTWQGGNLPSEDPTYLVRWPFDKVVTWKIQKSSIYSSTIPMATKLGRAVSCKGGTLKVFKVSWPFDCVVTLQIQKTCICSSTISMATELGRVLTWGGGTQSSKSRKHLITWSHEKWKKLISTLTQYLWPPNLEEW